MNETEAKEHAIKLVLCDMFVEYSQNMFTTGSATEMIKKYAPIILTAVQQVELDREYAS